MNKIEEKVAVGDLRFRDGQWLVMTRSGTWSKPFLGSQIALDVASGFVNNLYAVTETYSGSDIHPDIYGVSFVDPPFTGTRAECERESNRLRAEVGLPPLYPEKPRIEWKDNECFVDGEWFATITEGKLGHFAEFSNFTGCFESFAEAAAVVTSGAKSKVGAKCTN